MNLKQFCMILLLIFTNIQAANATSNTVQQDLLDASNQLTGVGRNLCVFLAADLPVNYRTQSGIAAIAWIKAGSSLNQANSPITQTQLENSLWRLKKTEAGSAIFQTLESHNIQNRYQPLTIHVGQIQQLLNTGAPMAFNTVIQTKPGNKGIPFMVLNAPAYSKNTSESQVALIVANELYDILGRMVAGEQVAATSNYQALGILLSDLILSSELAGKSPNFSKETLVTVYKKALKNYSGDVPKLNYENLSPDQKKTLDELTNLATAGHFKSFKALDTLS